MTAYAQRSFSSGEIAPALHARADQVRYLTGLRTLRNMYVMRHGGATSRPGTKFVCEILSSVGPDYNSGNIKLIPFIFNNDQTYVLELGVNDNFFSQGYIRVHKQGGTVLDDSLEKNIEGVSLANPAVITSTAHGFSLDDEVLIAGITTGPTELNNRRFIVANVNPDDFELRDYRGNNIDTSGSVAWSAGGTITPIVKIVSPIDDDDTIPNLQYDQTNDIITVVEAGFNPFEIQRLSEVSWSAPNITPGQPEATRVNGASFTIDQAAGNAAAYTVTAVSAITGEESYYPDNVLQRTSSVSPSVSTPVTLSWAAVTDAAYYKIYRRTSQWGFYGISDTTSFIDVGQGTIDYSESFPESTAYSRPQSNPITTYPGVVGSCQQRKFFSGVDQFPGKIWASRIGLKHNFALKDTSFPDDPSIFTLVGKQVNEIRHILDLGRPVIFTSAGEFILNGSSNGSITPTEINPKQQSAYGSVKSPSPVIVDGSAIFVQARGNTVRDLGYKQESDNYSGNELSLFSAHLLEGKTVVDWAYQEIPHKVLWIVLDDGSLLSMTYVKEQQIVGWARHDTDGLFKNVCVVPENNQDAVYFVVERTANGATRKYLERMTDRYVTEETLNQYTGVDCAVVYDGRVGTLFAGQTIPDMTLSGGTNYTYDETITLTCFVSFFTANDVGNQIFLRYDDGDLIRFTITGYTSGTVVTGKPHKTALTHAGIPTYDWGKAVDVVSGLEHLNDKAVAVYADGNVIHNPNDPDLDSIAVADGEITLNKPYEYITVGLPYYCDFETLDLEIAQSESMTDKKKLVTGVAVHMQDTQGLYIGTKPPDDDAQDPKQDLIQRRISLEEFEGTDKLVTKIEVNNILSQWNSSGRIFIRQIDPLPMTILAVTPTGLVPTRG